MWHISKNRVFLSVLLFSLLGACSDETELSVSDNGNAISFKATAVSMKETRTVGERENLQGNGELSVTSSSIGSRPAPTRGTLIEYFNELSSENGSFGVMAYETDGDFSYTAGATTLMNNQKVDVDRTDGTCSYTPVRFWTTDHTYTFMAYFPYVESAPNSYGLTLNPITGQNNILISYDAPTTAANQPDLMVSEIQKNCKRLTTNRDGYVNVNFQHALAAISAKVRANNIRIQEIRFSNICAKGDLTLCDEANNDLFSWTLDASSIKDFNLGLDVDAEQNYQSINGDVNATATDGYLMMLPQAFRDDASVSITFTDNQGLDQQTRKFYLKDYGLPQSWEAGKKYIYNITITPYWRLDVNSLEYTYEGGADTYHVYSEYIDSRGESEERAWEVDPSTIPDWLTLDTQTANGNTSGIATAAAQIGKESRDAVMQETPVVTDLNLAENGETANCYIVNAAGTYRFPANVMGVGSTGCLGLFDYLGNVTTDASIDLTGATAELLWQDRAGLIKSVGLSGDYITFETADQATIGQGNAVVCIKNGAGIIMWSWHLWFTNITLAGDDLASFNFSGNHNTILRYVLGFTDSADYYPKRTAQVKFTQTSTGKVTYATFTQHDYTVPELYTYSCTSYQWGRKDPFSCLMKPGTNDDTSRELYDISGGTKKYYTQSQDYANQPYFEDCLITTPMMFVRAGDRMLNSKTHGFSCWGKDSQKSIYDPCPPGFMVSARRMFIGVKMGLPSERPANVFYYTLETPDGAEIMKVYPCGSYYGRGNVSPGLGLRAVNYGDRNATRVIWLDDPISTTYSYNRWSLDLNHSTYSPNTVGEEFSQSMCHSYYVVPTKR